ncbi:MAG: recombinase family protein, partial [bacterium]|nr:recombinase family protein [bacterium]
MPRPHRNRTSSAVAIQPAVRCAIYTRKSTNEGLDQAFNSLHNQRDAGESYVASQRHENWTVLTDQYDDGGFSGGNTERPALKRLLTDAEAGRIDIIVVYKLDRLSRSLLDFLNLHRSLEALGVQIVSVTEPIDTRTPIGRAFVNILVSFGQMEREVAGERTSHKIQAARRRGRWTGGHPPLGYDTVPEGGRIVVNKVEAEQVKAIFQLYAETPSLVEVAQELNRRGWRTKAWTAKTKRPCGGKKWNNASVRNLLRNPLYIGKQKLGEETFNGDHESIVTKKLFDQVQRLLTANRTSGGAGARNRHGFLLRGLLRCSACNASMVPTPTSKGARLYRYYTCRAAQKNGHATCPTRSVNADKVEAFVVDQIRRIGADPELQHETFRQAVAEVKAKARGRRLEAKRLKNDLTPAKADVERLVAELTRRDGPAADAIAAELTAAQERLAQIKGRQAEIKTELADLKAQSIDRDDLTRALEAFDP